MKHSTGIIYDAFKICGTIFKLDVRISIEVISHYQRVEIRYANDSYKCNFEVDLNQPYKEFDDEVNSKMRQAFKMLETKKTNRYVSTTDHSSVLTVQQEQELNIEIIKLKEDFHKRVQKQNRMKSFDLKDLERYNKINGFGEF